MREWNNSDVVKVLDECKPLAELTDVNQIAKATYSRRQLILLDLTSEKAI